MKRTKLVRMIRIRIWNEQILRFNNRIEWSESENDDDKIELIPGNRVNSKEKITKNRICRNENEENFESGIEQELERIKLTEQKMKIGITTQPSLLLFIYFLSIILTEFWVSGVLGVCYPITRLPLNLNSRSRKMRHERLQIISD